MILNKVLLFCFYFSMVASATGVVMGMMGIISGGVAFPLGWQLLIPAVVLFMVVYWFFKKIEKEIEKGEK